MTGAASNAVLYGARCADSTHPGHGTVYACNQGPHRLQGLAAGVPCYELVASHDGGVTWAAVPVPTLVEATANLVNRAWQREAERLQAELEQVRAELATVTGERDDALLLVQDGMPEPCQPIGCDNGHHLAGCVYAAADPEQAVDRG